MEDYRSTTTISKDINRLCPGFFKTLRKKFIPLTIKTPVLKEYFGEEARSKKQQRDFYNLLKDNEIFGAKVREVCGAVKTDKIINDIDHKKLIHDDNYNMGYILNLQVVGQL